MRLSRNQTIVALLLIALLFGFTVFQASWLAPSPAGAAMLISDHAVDPVRSADGCIADANSAFGRLPVGPDVGALQGAAGSGADMVRITTEVIDGAVMPARQYKSTCPADAARPRGTVNEVVGALSKPMRLWDIKGALAADRIRRILPDDGRDAFLGDAYALKVIRAARPKALAFSVAEARQCAADYRSSGIWGNVPPACKGRVMLLTLDDLGYTLWGWPNRFLARMKDAGVTVVIAESVDGDRVKGLTDMHQYGEIAHSYDGYIWIDDIAELGPALKR